VPPSFWDWPSARYSTGSKSLGCVVPVTLQRRIRRQIMKPS